MCTLARGIEMSCWGCFGFAFTRKPKRLARLDAHMGIHMSQEFLLNEKVEDEDDYSYNGNVTDTGDGDDGNFLLRRLAHLFAQSAVNVPSLLISDSSGLTIALAGTAVAFSHDCSDLQSGRSPSLLYSDSLVEISALARPVLDSVRIEFRHRGLPSLLSSDSSVEALALVRSDFHHCMTCCSSRRYGAPAPNRVGNGALTRPHAPFEDRRVRSVSATRPGRSHALPRARGRTHAPARAKERLPRAEQTAHAPGGCWYTRHAREGSHAPERRQLCATSALTRCHVSVTLTVDLPQARRREMGSTDQSESQALVSEGSRERGRGQGRGHHRGTEKGRWRSQARGRTVRCFYYDQEGHIKRDCPKYKAQDQSSDTAATTVMAVDENEFDVLLAASDDGNFEASGGILRVSKENKEMLWGKKTRGLYRLEGNVQTGGATVRHGSSGISEKNEQGKQPLHRGTQSKRRGTWRIRSGTRAQGDALGYVRKSGQTRVVQPVQDVYREAQRKETKSILRSCTAKGAATPKRVFFALDLISGGVLSSCAHKGGEMEPRQLAK
ncbi:hypothetical protein Acr_28g0011730 [Actinidia rufa]|uniref:Uncharacterized protein n=1 Tax=Actinidia rufa TaxID=165716 RepID=A0A7J0HBP3_9ERIC|nr:hypothetical protein Acr_28g0011730 [Actinidia rufa]